MPTLDSVEQVGHSLEIRIWPDVHAQSTAVRQLDLDHDSGVGRRRSCRGQDAHRQERGHRALGPCLDIVPKNPHPGLERAEHDALLRGVFLGAQPAVTKVPNLLEPRSPWPPLSL